MGKPKKKIQSDAKWFKMDLDSEKSTFSCHANLTVGGEEEETETPFSDLKPNQQQQRTIFMG